MFGFSDQPFVFLGLHTLGADPYNTRPPSVLTQNKFDDKLELKIDQSTIDFVKMQLAAFEK